MVEVSPNCMLKYGDSSLQMSVEHQRTLNMELALGVPRTSAQAMLKREPTLAQLSTLEVKARLEHLARALQAQPAARAGGNALSVGSPLSAADLQLAMEAMLRQPRLLLATPSDIDLRMKALRAMLRVSSCL